MSTRVIECEVTNEYVKGGGVVAGAAGSHDDVLLRLSFGEMWDGLTKQITWTDSRGVHPALTILTADMLESDDTSVYLVPIPAEPKAYEGTMYMTIKGVSVEDDLETRATLSVCTEFTILPSMWDPDAEESQDVSPSQAAQLQAEIDAVLEDITEIVQRTEDAEAWAVGQRGGIDVEDTDETYHNNAKYYAAQAENGADNAETAQAAAEAAQGKAEDAQTAAEAARTAAETAQNAAEVAEGEAEGAQTAAEAAQSAAETAQGAAEAAQSKAEDARTAAEAAYTRLASKLWFGTIAEYNALEEIDPDVYYNIEEPA